MFNFLAANADAPLIIEIEPLMNKYLQTRPLVCKESFKSNQMHFRETASLSPSEVKT